MSGAESLAALCLLVAASTQAEQRWLTGEVRAAQAEPILAPPSNFSPVVLRYLAPEGNKVVEGDVLVRVDPGQSASEVLRLEGALELLQATAQKDLATLQVAAADAERASIEAESALAKARVDAGIPRAFLSALDFDRHAGELQRAEREFALKQSEWDTAIDAVERKRSDAALELRKMQADLDYHRIQVGNAEQRATTAGHVVYGFDPFRGTRYDEGASANPGMRIGEVVGSGGMEVRAWALEPDRVGLREEQDVLLHFDALPAVTARGRITRISGAPDTRVQWGEGRYFSIDIVLDQPAPDRLLSGMSVRVEVTVEPPSVPAVPAGEP